ncbi:hypothetical protein [Paractinoplanes abujensis]|uniref:Uncharacterized protein n=1 Tax=Paractinoplanes abujensis TaxID=882441 RepID=A0A7W7CMH9_9ACTN|nr:hypothetical protein [Actinoplanes abujensis]MBB4691305.1 hypothetical protein [Actinoplanes abujensis]
MVIAVLSAAGAAIHRYFRKPDDEKVLIFLGQTGPDLEGYRAAANDWLAGENAVEVVGSTGPKPDLVIGLYGLRYSAAAVSEFDSVKPAPGGRRRLWLLGPDSSYQTSGAQTSDPESQATEWAQLRARVDDKNPDPLPDSRVEFVRELVAAVHESRRAKFPARRRTYLLDPQAFLIGGAVALTASIYFAIRTPDVTGWGTALLIALLSALSGVAGYAFRVGCRWILR